MTVASLSRELGLWEDICENIRSFAGRKSARLIDLLAELPIERSHATRRLGSYVTRNGRPVCIRLQFAQEPENLKQTLLHELAHACDHLSVRFAGRYRRAHGPSWQAWAEALGTSAKSCGRSQALDQLHRQRQKLVAVCQNCGAEFHRVRRLNQGRKYYHTTCGCPLRLL